MASTAAVGPAPAAIEPQTVILRDGAAIELRAVSERDLLLIAALFQRMSPESMHHRFFCMKREMTETELRFLAGNGADHVVIAAAQRRGDAEVVLGLGRYVVHADHPAIAEVAFEVADADQGRGIGTLLLDHLAEIARDRGLTMFQADVEAGNTAMLDVFSQSGFAVHESCSQGTNSVDFPIAATAGFLTAYAERERIAEAAARRRVLLNLGRHSA
jgi:GNAT superfamily N-acetyltransferase